MSEDREGPSLETVLCRLLLFPPSYQEETELHVSSSVYSFCLFSSWIPCFQILSSLCSLSSLYSSFTLVFSPVLSSPLTCRPYLFFLSSLFIHYSLLSFLCSLSFHSFSFISFALFLVSLPFFFSSLLTSIGSSFPFSLLISFHFLMLSLFLSCALLYWSIFPFSFYFTFLLFPFLMSPLFSCFLSSSLLFPRILSSVIEVTEDTSLLSLL